MVGCRQRGAVITVVDPDAARRSLVAGELACPQPDCGGRLRVWSRALPRRVRGLDGTVVRVTPDRARCRACRVSHVLLPAGWLPRRGHDVEIVGAALLAAAEGAGYRRAASRVDVPASTVRDWIHAARDGAAGLISAVSGVIEAAGARLHPPQAPPVLAGRPGQHIHHQLRVVDPTGALAGLRGWPLINVLSRGRLLTCGPAG